MLTSYSSKAVLAKSHTMFGKLITDGDYNSLLNCKSVTDIASYLKNNDRYGKYLKTLSEHEAHRGKLEVMLRNAYYNECAALCRYEITVGDCFYKFVIDKAIIGVIMNFLTLLSSKRHDEYIYSIPVYMDKHSPLDLKALGDVESYDDLISLSKGTHYYEIFKKNKPVNNIYDFAKIENDLYIDLYKDIFRVIDEYTHGREKKELNDIFNSYIDCVNFDRIMRLKKFFSLHGNEIENNLIPYGSLSKKQLDAMINADSERDIYTILNSSAAGRKVDKCSKLGSTEIAARYLIKKSKRNMHYSTYPSIVMLSYLFLAENEFYNITTIIEGVRYNVSPDVMRELIIL